MKTSNGLQEYLELAGVLEHGTPEDVQRAKETYRREYNRRYSRAFRQRKREVRLTLDRKERAAVQAALQQETTPLAEKAKQLLLEWAGKRDHSPSQEEWRELIQVVSRLRSSWDQRVWPEEPAIRRIGKELQELDERLRGRLFHRP